MYYFCDYISVWCGTLSPHYFVTVAKLGQGKFLGVETPAAVSAAQLLRVVYLLVHKILTYFDLFW